NNLQFGQTGSWRDLPPERRRLTAHAPNDTRRVVRLPPGLFHKAVALLRSRSTDQDVTRSPSAPFSASFSIVLSSSPNSRKISSVCSPSRGGRRRIEEGDAVNCNGLLGTRSL